MGVIVGVEVVVLVGVFVALSVGVLVMVGDLVGVSEGVLVVVEVSVGLAVWVLVTPPFLILKEMMIVPVRIARIAMIPIMVLDFIASSLILLKALPGSQCRVRCQSTWS